MLKNGFRTTYFTGPNGKPAKLYEKVHGGKVKLLELDLIGCDFDMAGTPALEKFREEVQSYWRERVALIPRGGVWLPNTKGALISFSVLKTDAPEFFERARNLVTASDNLRVCTATA